RAGDLTATMAGTIGPWSVARQFEDSEHVGELPLPVGPEFVALRPAQHFRLPLHEVAMTGGERRQSAPRACRVKGPHLFQGDHERPEIADDMMRRRQQDMIVGSAGEQKYSE